MNCETQEEENIVGRSFSSPVLLPHDSRRGILQLRISSVLPHPLAEIFIFLHRFRVGSVAEMADEQTLFQDILAAGTAEHMVVQADIGGRDVVRHT